MGRATGFTFIFFSRLIPGLKLMLNLTENRFALRRNLPHRKYPVFEVEVNQWRTEQFEVIEGNSSDIWLLRGFRVWNGVAKAALGCKFKYYASILPASILATEWSQKAIFLENISRTGARFFLCSLSASDIEHFSRGSLKHSCEPVADSSLGRNLILTCHKAIRKRIWH